MAVQTKVWIEKGKAVVTLHGRFDFGAHGEFRDCCKTCLDDMQVREIELGMGAVEYLDSSALGMLLMLKERADAVAKRVVLADCRGAVKQVLDIANFGRIFSIT